jgi:cell division septation protein DedD
VRPAIVACVVVACLAFGSIRAGAQTDPRLADAVRAAQEGQSDSARAAVQRLLNATSPSDTLYPQILYTQAMVASSAGEMRRQLQRVTVEYATSDWADDALLRLVQMDYATRNFEGAARNLERLRVDFPATPLMAQAAYWAGRTYFDSNNPQAACRWVADGIAQVRGDVELQNQLSYLYQRCDLRPDSGATAQASTDTSVRDSTARTGQSPAPAPVPPSTSSSTGAFTPPATSARTATRTVYRVQIAAVGSRKGAEDAARKARPLGLSVVTVEQGGLYKVRVGEYTTRDAAQTAASSLKAKLGGSPFVVSEP